MILQNDNYPECICPVCGRTYELDEDIQWLADYGRCQECEEARIHYEIWKTSRKEKA